MKVFEKFVKTDDRHRKITPCYPTMRIILKNMLINKTPIILKIDQFVKQQQKPYNSITMLIGNQGNGNYSIFKEPSKLQQKGAVFIHAKSITDAPQNANTLEEKIRQSNLTDLILSGAADHPQYGSDEKNGRPEDAQCEEHRKLADELGTSRKNPSLFLVEHIFVEHIHEGIIGNSVSD